MITKTLCHWLGIAIAVLGSIEVVKGNIDRGLLCMTSSGVLYCVAMLIPKNKEKSDGVS